MLELLQKCVNYLNYTFYVHFFCTFLHQLRERNNKKVLTLQRWRRLRPQLQLLLLDSQRGQLPLSLRQVRVQLSDLILEAVLHVALLDRQRLDVVGKPLDLHLQVPNQVVPLAEEPLQLQQLGRWSLGSG